MRVSISVTWPFFLFLFSIGGVLVTAVLAIGYYEKLIEFVIASQTRIVAGTPSYDAWQKIPIPVYLRIRFFNITNPEGLAAGERAKLNEMGPYVYKEEIEKFDVTFDKEADTVRYRQVRWYYFQPQLSDGRESDLITMINIPFVGAAKIINDYTNQKFILSTFESMLADKGEKLTSQHRVREILFDGFSVENILELANSDIVKQAHKVKILKPITKFKVPSRLANGKMGFLEGRNGSDEGWMVVRTGIQSSNDFGRIVSWKNQTRLRIWRGAACNTPRGTDGIIYQPFLTPEIRLEAFVPDVCRSLYFDKFETMQHGQVEAFRFRQPEEMYETVVENPDNVCYCPSAPKNLEKCPPKGVLSIATCFEGAPVMMSQPHFLFADPAVQEGVEGLAPDEEKHWGYLDLHPKTGLSVEVRQRIQFAIELNQWPTMPTFAKLKPAFIPMLWLEEGGDLEGLNLYLLVFLDVSGRLWRVGKWGLVGLFGVMTIGSLVLLKNRGRGKKPDKEKADDLSPKVKAPPPEPEKKRRRERERSVTPPPEPKRLSKAPPMQKERKEKRRRRRNSSERDSDSGRSGSSASYDTVYNKY